MNGKYDLRDFKREKAEKIGGDWAVIQGIQALRAACREGDGKAAAELAARLAGAAGSGSAYNIYLAEALAELLPAAGKLGEGRRALLELFEIALCWCEPGERLPARALGLLRSALEGRGRCGDAGQEGEYLEALRRAALRLLGPANTWAGAARRCRDEKKYDEALLVYAMLDAFTLQPGIKARVGEVLLEQGHYESAARALRRALVFADRREAGDIYIMLGACMAGLQNFGLAEKYYKLASGAEAMYRAGLLRKDQREYTEAVELFQRALSLKPSKGLRGKLLYQIGCSLESGGHQSLARRYLQQAKRAGVSQAAARLEKLPPPTAPSTACDSDAEKKRFDPAPLFGEPRFKLESFVGAKHKEFMETHFLLPQRDPKLAAKYGMDSPLLVLAVGCPGAGKSFFFEAVAGSSGALFARISPSSFGSSWVFQPEQNLARIFDFAEKKASERPVVLLLEELGDSFGKRDSTGEVFERRLVAQVLLLIDRVSTLKKPMLIAATSNNPGFIDSALVRRGGRIAHHLYFGLPSTRERSELARLFIGPLAAPGLDFSCLAAEPYTGAEIRTIAAEARHLAFLEACGSKKVVRITKTHLAGAMAKFPPRDYRQYKETAKGLPEFFSSGEERRIGFK